ncbi:MAG: hypothetical protein LBS10_02205 [Gracilibacteraceae bacterium]|jgi:hypothetical protein|nr:hypothetical protein [Gracilibacteraceae bacterium]
MNLNKYWAVTNLIAAALIAGMLFIGDVVSFNLAYIAIFVFAAVRTLLSSAKKRIKFYLLAAYFFVMLFQLSICNGALFAAEERNIFDLLARRVFGLALMLLPFLISRYISAGKYSSFYLPSLQEAATISFAELNAGVEMVTRLADRINEAGKSISTDNVKSIAAELPRHDSFRYVNNGTLTEEYFAQAEASLADPHMYIMISNTGSAASEIISIFTQNHFNHASLSFDRELQTVISYNGGARAYPPGLNRELLEYFNQKPDASILVYRLDCSPEQKKRILSKVEEINREGSAYNMMGLVLKRSFRPNIMFCSQFVYRMLQFADLAYFTKPDGQVSPTDLIERDYHRRLQFVKEIKLNQGD